MKTNALWVLTGMIVAAACASLPTLAQARKAKCIVSGKPVEVTPKTPRVFVNGKAQYFCCENCPREFAKLPEKYVREVGLCPIIGGKVETIDAGHRVVVNNGLWYACCPGCLEGIPNSTLVRKDLVDVVSGKSFTATAASPKSEHRGQTYFFESAETQAAFAKEPAKHAVVYGR